MAAIAAGPSTPAAGEVPLHGHLASNQLPKLSRGESRRRPRARWATCTRGHRAVAGRRRASRRSSQRNRGSRRRPRRGSGRHSRRRPRRASRRRLASPAARPPAASPPTTLSGRMEQKQREGSGGMAQTRSRWREGEETCAVEKERRSADDKAPVGPAHMDGKQSTAGGDMLRSTVNSASLDRRGSSEARLLSSGVVTQF